MAYVFISGLWGTLPCNHCLSFGGFADPDHCWRNHFAWEYSDGMKNLYAKDSFIAFIPGEGVPEADYDAVCDTLKSIIAGARV